MARHSSVKGQDAGDARALYAQGMSGPGELDLIRAIRARAGGGSALRLGIGDDCAVLRPPRGHDIVVTTDYSLEGRHFRREWHPAEAVGHRCLARGLSDLAAMGARPLAAFLSLALPAGMLRRAGGRRWVEGFLDGLLRLGELTGTPLAGGDTAGAPDNSVLADIVLVGAVPQGRELRRSGARPGDGLYVTGTLGGAALEFEQIQAAPSKFRRAVAGGEGDVRHAHLFPEPRLGVGAALVRRRIAAAAIDLSDGMSTDLAHLCEESGLGAVVDAAALPLATGATLNQALHGGEDYDLLFTARPGTRVPRQIAGVRLTRVGEMTRRRGVRIRAEGRTAPLPAGGWEHGL